MQNPFEVIDARLSNIENLILDIKHQPKQIEKSSQSDELLSVEQTASFLNLQKATIYNLVSNRKIPYSKKGKRLYFSKKQLLLWIEEGRRKTHSEIAADADAYLSKTSNKKG